MDSQTEPDHAADKLVDLIKRQTGQFRRGRKPAARLLRRWFPSRNRRRNPQRGPALECLEPKLLLTAPMAFSSEYDVLHDDVLTGAYVSGMADPEATMTFAVFRAPNDGVLSLFDSTTGTFEYTPNASFAGADSFEFTVSAGGQTSAPATVSIDVTNTVPFAQGNDGMYGMAASVVHDRTLVDWAMGWDEDPGDSEILTYSISTSPTSGSVTIDPGTGEYTYTPNALYVGLDSFEFTVSDGIDSSDPATITIDVTNQAPTANPEDEFNIGDTQTSVVIDIVGNDTDPDGDSLTGVIVSSPSYGTLSPNTDGTFTYTPTVLTHYGLDSFSYVANDGIANSDTIVAQVRRFGLQIKKGNTDVTGNFNSALMGEKVSFAIGIKGGFPFLLKDKRWGVIETDAFKSWSVVNQMPVLKSFSFGLNPRDPDLVGGTVDVHYSAPGLKTVGAAAEYRGVTLTADTYVNVVRPTISVAAAITTPLQLLNPTSDNPKWGGKIDFTPTVTTTTGGGNVGAGYDLRWVQLIDLYAEADLSVGPTVKYDGKGLDTGYPYPFGSPSGASDAPGHGTADYDELLYTVDFDMYLMFKPAGGQWVAIHVTDYGMFFHKKRDPTGVNWVDADSTSPGYFTIGSSGVTDGHPEWTNVVTSRNSYTMIPDGTGLI